MSPRLNILCTSSEKTLIRKVRMGMTPWARLLLRWERNVAQVEFSLNSAGSLFKSSPLCWRYTTLLPFYPSNLHSSITHLQKALQAISSWMSAIPRSSVAPPVFPLFRTDGWLTPNQQHWMNWYHNEFAFRIISSVSSSHFVVIYARSNLIKFI